LIWQHRWHRQFRGSAIHAGGTDPAIGGFIPTVRSFFKYLSTAGFAPGTIHIVLAEASSPHEK